MQENPTDPNIEDEDDELTALMNSFAERGSGLKKANDAFQAILVAPMYNLKDVMAEFISCTHADQLYALKKFALDRVSYNETARLMLTVTNLSPLVLQPYYDYLKDTYPLKSLPDKESFVKQLLPTDKTDKVKVKELNDSVKEFQQLHKDTVDYNQKLTEVMECVRQFSVVAKLGNEQLSVDGLPSVYYRFAVNDKEDYTNAFLKEAWVIGAALMQTVARTVITDVTRKDLEKQVKEDAENEAKAAAINIGGALVHQVQNIVIDENAPLEGEDAFGIYDITGHKDVTFYFHTVEEAAHFEQNKELLDQLFDKYKRYYRSQ